MTDYVATAEPVGSHLIASHYELGVRSATIRSELAELSDLGYLRQPHTSAGRIPSDLGYRFYVDRLMGAAMLPRSEAVRASRRLVPRRTEMDIILEQTCQILADLAHYTSMATHPAVKEASISHISVASVGRRKLLIVLVLDTGRVVHELLDLRQDRGGLTPAKATSFLMRKVSGRALESAAAALAEPLHEPEAAMEELVGKVRAMIAREIESAEQTQIQLGGTSYIMQQPEFKDVERLEAMLSVLEQRSALYELFSSVYVGPEVTVIIGSENPVREMQDCSFVGTKYRIGGRVAGTIGILGPTRMDYHRATAAVQFMAANLGDLLTRLSVA